MARPSRSRIWDRLVRRYKTFGLWAATVPSARGGLASADLPGTESRGSTRALACPPRRASRHTVYDRLNFRPYGVTAFVAARPCSPCPAPCLGRRLHSVQVHQAQGELIDVASVGVHAPGDAWLRRRHRLHSAFGSPSCRRAVQRRRCLQHGLRTRSRDELRKEQAVHRIAPILLHRHS